jgi:hypothetical protein
LSVSLIRSRRHCGNLTIEFETAIRVGQLQLRADQCSFCRKHGARTTSDPKGQAKIFAREPLQVVRYRCAQRTADFLICERCGIYLGAVLSTDDGSAYATLNVNCFDRADELTQAAAPVSYQAESASERIARTRVRWTPARLDF